VGESAPDGDGRTPADRWRGPAGVLFSTRLPLAARFADHLSSSGVERGLLGPREVPRIWDRHILNCAAVASLLPPGAEVADIGSGAGLPGIPLAIARPDVTVRLVDPLLRRTTWLSEVVPDLGLVNVEIVRARAEDLAGRLEVDVVTARAVAPLPRLAELCLPLVRPGGLLLALKGREAACELSSAAGTLRAQGGRRWRVELCGEGVLEVPTTVIVVEVDPRRKRRPGRAEGSPLST
jgi:16S rRNA (guanine527-N7)-methyltransferase